MPLFRPKLRCTHCGFWVRKPRDASRFLCPTCDKPGPWATQDQVSEWGAEEAERRAAKEGRTTARSRYKELLSQLGSEPAGSVQDSELETARAATGYTDTALTKLHMDAFRPVATLAVADDLLTPDESTHLAALLSALGLTWEEVRQTDPGLWEHAFVSAINGGQLPEVSSPHILQKKGEVAHYECTASLMREVAVRQYQGGYQGFSIPLGKSGVRYKVGASRGHSVQVGTQLQVADTGLLTVTNKRAVYAGTSKTVEMLYSKLVNLTVYSDGLQFHLSNRVNAPLFGIPQGSDIVGAIVNRAAQGVE